MIGQLNFVILHVRDMEATRAFYTEKLGFALEAASPAFVQFRPEGGATLALQKDDQAAPALTTEVWWQASDVDGLHKTLLGRGVEIASAPQDQPFGRTLAIKDPEGNLLNMYQLRQA